MTHAAGVKTFTEQYILAEMRKYLAAHFGVDVAGAISFENAYALAMRADDVRRLAGPRGAGIPGRRRNAQTISMKVGHVCVR